MNILRPMHMNQLEFNQCIKKRSESNFYFFFLFWLFSFLNNVTCAFLMCCLHNDADRFHTKAL